MAHDPHKHHRRTLRLSNATYAARGSYYVTICAHRRGRVFGTVKHRTVVHNPIGRIVYVTWLSLPEHYPHVRIDAFVVMPDHIHGILTFDGTNIGTADSGADDGSTGVAPRLRPGSLPVVIRAFKSAATREVNTLRNTPGASLWQHRYYEHIVRDDADMERIRRYIADNPARWRRPK
jgi:REP element-mobilizing transposase RayT